MTTFVVPLDGSALAEVALRPACALASRVEGSRVLLVFCAARLESETESYLRDRAAMFAAVTDIETRIVVAEPPDGICEAVASVDDSMLFMATHGHGGVRSTILGSVAEAVLLRSDQPLVLVGPRCRSALLPAERGRMLICTDGSVHADGILPVAARWARSFGLAAWVAEVVGPEEQVRLDGEPIRNLQVEEATARLHERAALLADRGVSATIEVLHGADPGQSITHYATHLPASIIALATHGRKGIDRLTLGSVAMSVVRVAPCPVLLARPT
jgi:nucleotide-binding universal stress UspA family protein